MKKETKNRIFALFIIFVFVGSSAAFALMSTFVPTTNPSVQLAYDKPLTNEEEAQFFKDNKIVLKSFTSDECGKPCEDSSTLVSDLFQKMQGNVVIESININAYPDEAERYGVTTVPLFVFRGKTEKTLPGDASYEDLVATACDLFFQENDVCIV